MGLLSMGLQFGWAYYRIIFCGLTFGSNFFSDFLSLLLALKIFQKIENLWVYSKVYDTLKVGLLQRWIVPILHVIFLILLHSCNLLLILSLGNQRKLKIYGYIQKFWHFESCPSSNVNCAISTCYLFDFFAQLHSPVNTKSREPKKIGNLWVYSKVMTLCN